METSIKSLLVHMDGTAAAGTRLNLAHQLAAAWHAQVSALFAVTPRYLSVLPLVPGIPSMPSGAPVDPDHRLLAMSAFEEARLSSTQPCEWLELNGEPVIESFSRRALTADLLFLGQRDPEDASGYDVPADFVESVVIESGRPAFVVPYAGAASVAPKVVLVAWKPTRECARAVTCALVFLQGASRVCLIEEGSDQTQAAPVEVREYLRLHGISKVHEQARLSERHAGEELLSAAADCGAEMIVMGCYGHSRARELVLGGATRTVLESTRIPVLMAH
jgi:nucleotide-binding universal stress UspA family protein